MQILRLRKYASMLMCEQNTFEKCLRLDTKEFKLDYKEWEKKYLMTDKLYLPKVHATYMRLMIHATMRRNREKLSTSEDYKSIYKPRQRELDP